MIIKVVLFKSMPKHKWISQITCDCFSDEKTLVALNSNTGLRPEKNYYFTFKSILKTFTQCSYVQNHNYDLKSGDT